LQQTALLELHLPAQSVVLNATPVILIQLETWTALVVPLATFWTRAALLMIALCCLITVRLEMVDLPTVLHVMMGSPKILVLVTNAQLRSVLTVPVMLQRVMVASWDMVWWILTLTTPQTHVNHVESADVRSVSHGQNTLELQRIAFSARPATCTMTLTQDPVRQPKEAHAKNAPLDATLALWIIPPATMPQCAPTAAVQHGMEHAPTPTMPNLDVHSAHPSASHAATTPAHRALSVMITNAMAIMPRTIIHLNVMLVLTTAMHVSGTTPSPPLCAQTTNAAQAMARSPTAHAQNAPTTAMSALCPTPPMPMTHCSATPAPPHMDLTMMSVPSAPPTVKNALTFPAP